MKIALINENSQAAKNGIIDQELVRGAVAGEQFQKLFFQSCKDQAIADYVRTLL